MVPTPDLSGRGGPAPQLRPDPEGSRAWEELRSVLLRSGIGQNREDLVQEVLVKLVARGRSPGQPETLGLARFMLKCLRVDWARAERLRSVQTGVEPDQCAAKAMECPVETDCRCWFTALEQKALGRKALELLNAIVSGLASTESLAGCFGVDTRSISRRRRRLQRVLEGFLQECPPSDGSLCDPRRPSARLLGRDGHSPHTSDAQGGS